MYIQPVLRRLAAAGSVGAVLLLAGCASGGGSTVDPYGAPSSMADETPSSSAAQSPSAEESSAPAADEALALRTAETDLGSIVVDGAGMTLYMFTKDSPDVSACEGQCLENWPPLIGEPTAGSGVDESLLGSFEREDGRVQATYNQWPLYYWVGDSAPGDTSGQDVQNVWFVLGADGEPIK